MPTIESRITMDISYNAITRQYIGVAYDYKTGEKLVEVRQWDDYWLRQNLHDAVSSFLKEWPTCDQTSTSELQYRKTIISSCGRLKVRESLS
ncbi:DNA repair protein [Salmonella phage BP12B]|uniref:Uncharacterized protein n=1 Tax=Salmonella phage BP12B TaxID=1543201 RepID=A0A140XFS4_9CAUD|nr:DNA repair protein [Salmonella phage BP12B]AIT13694.1 hypothetical protein BP12B_18A [Salmonella phage BP12B]